MKWLPQGLAGRLLLAFVAAAAAIAVLAVTVQRRDAVRAAGRRAAARPLTPPPPALGLMLAPCGGRVLLASRIEAVPPDVAPVVQVLADGSAALRRRTPLAAAPLVGPTPGDAVILLPERSLAALSPAVRATLLDVVGQLLPGRPVAAERLAAVDVVVPAGELAALLRWLP